MWETPVVLALPVMVAYPTHMSSAGPVLLFRRNVLSGLGEGRMIGANAMRLAGSPGSVVCPGGSARWQAECMSSLGIRALVDICCDHAIPILPTEPGAGGPPLYILPILPAEPGAGGPGRRSHLDVEQIPGLSFAWFDTPVRPPPPIDPSSSRPHRRCMRGLGAQHADHPRRTLTHRAFNGYIP